MSDEAEAKTAARHRAVEACVDWAIAHGYESPVVLSYLVIVEIITPDTDRQVIWVGGNGNDPSDEDRAGLMRYQIRGLMSEIEWRIRDATNE